MIPSVNDILVNLFISFVRSAMLVFYDNGQVFTFDIDMEFYCIHWIWLSVTNTVFILTILIWLFYSLYSC